MTEPMGGGQCIRMRCDLEHNLRNNLWCLFPKFSCECSYRRLYDCSQEFFNNAECNAKIPFYLHDFKWVAIDVECEVAATTLCDILARKIGIPEDPKWCIVEYYRDKNFRRVLEDSDDVLRNHEELLDFSNGAGKLFFEYIETKDLMYEPVKLLDRPYAWFREQTEGTDYFSRHNKYCFMVQGDDSITLVTDCWFKIPCRTIWNKGYLLLQNGFVKLVNRETAIKIIKNNKPHPVDEDRQWYELRDSDIFTRIDRGAPLSVPYQWICKSSSSPLQSKPFIKHPRGLNAKEMKVYTRVEQPEDLPPTNHIIVLIEKETNSEQTNGDPEKTLEEQAKEEAPKKTKQSWSSIKAKFIGKKKEREGPKDMYSPLYDSNSSDDDVGCNGAKPKRNLKNRRRWSSWRHGNSRVPQREERCEEYVGAEESLYLEEYYDDAGNKYKIMNIAFDANYVMSLWIDILRYTKTGNFLRINSNTFYRKLRNLQMEEADRNFNQSHNYFVTMDFTGPEGRIIDENEPSTSRMPSPPVREERWFQNFVREPSLPYRRQLIPCRKPPNLPSTSRDIENIVEEEESYVEMNNSPRSILKKNKSPGSKKKVEFQLVRIVNRVYELAKTVMIKPLAYLLNYLWYYIDRYRNKPILQNTSM